MSTNILNRPDISAALADLKTLLAGVRNHIDDVSLFGSTVTIPVEEARDIDFFVAYKDISFEEVRQRLLSVPLHRGVVIETLEAHYANHPEWPKEDPLRIHIVLYRKGVSKFSEKLVRTKAASIDVSGLLC